MKKQIRAFINNHREIIQVVLSMVIVVASAYDMIGQPARLVMIVTLFAGALGSGIGLGMLVERKRAERRSRT